MAKRGPRQGRDLPDWHLWTEVKRSVVPLRPDLEAKSPPAIAMATAPAPQRPAPGRAAISGLPVPRPPEPRRPTPPGRVIEPNLRKKLVRGRIDIDARIDLHGLRQDEAREALRRFVVARSERGDRTLLVITGKGLKKLGDDAAVLVERGVLRAMLPVWLAEPRLAALIGGWEPASRAHGGEGAFYVRLRRAAP